MARSDVTERIAASPGKVWAFFQPEQFGRWYGLPVKPAAPGPFHKGARLKIGVTEATITEYAENRTLAWETREKRAVHRVTFLLAQKEGATVVLLRYELFMEGPLARLIERFAVGGLTTRSRKALGRLKRLVEQGG